MLKYVSWILIAVALVWTWKLTYSEPAVGMDVHATVQREVSDMIRSYIKEKRPTVSNIRFHKLYTETINPTKIRAVFKYTFIDSMSDEEDTEQVFEGQAILNKDTSSTSEESIWTLDEVTADNKALVFKKGLEIRPGSGEAPPEEHKNEPARPADPAHSHEQHDG